MPVFLDTNIILRHLLRDDEEKAYRCKDFLSQLEQAKIKARTSDIVIHEVVFVLERTYRQPKAEIRDLLLPIILFPGLILPGKRQYARAFDLYVGKNISFADASNAALMERLNITEVVSYDLHFDRIEGLKRIEP
ncbi:MAG: PIN domain-containing protein [Chloroflexi bacterium]|nr:PIN domain-containing protein [Chloroflexota bacterium]